jgi:GMP reductase
LSAVIECADAAHGLDGHIIADGGCTSPGDVVKAFAAGADFVMLGGMLAGHDEGGGTVEGNKVKFYGMSSKEAQGNDFKDYRASEGRVVEIPYRGPVDPTVHDILGGLRSACTYVGARTLKQLSKCATFVRVNNQFNGVYTGNTVGE